MNIDPLAPLRALLFCVIAFVLGALIAGVPGYFVGKAHGAESKMESIGSLKTSVDSCTVAAEATKKVVDAEALEGKAREQRVADAFAQNAKRAAEETRKALRQRTTPIRGDTECDQTKNAINDVFRGKR